MLIAGILIENRMHTIIMENNNQAYRLLYNWNAKHGEDDAARLVRDNKVLLIWIITGVVCAAIFFFLVLKWYLEMRFDVRFCSGYGRERRMIARRDSFIESTQRRRDAAIAAKLNEEEQKVEIERKRVLLSDFTITVEEAHLEFDQDDLGIMEEGNIPQQDADDADGDHAATLHIPGKHRTSAECRICLADIAAGESIVYSPNSDCIHIYHDTCILSWLSESKAKSDCPCCRLPFIPEAYNNNDHLGSRQGSSTDTDTDEGESIGSDEEERT